MNELERDDDAIRLLEVIKDAVWSLEHNCPIGALAVLRGAVEREQRRQSQVKVNYLYRAA